MPRSAMSPPLPAPIAHRSLALSSLPYVAAAFLVFLGWVAYTRTFPLFPVFPMDDAYIVIHNAQVLLSGSDPNYPGSSALAGTTSEVHLALVSGLMRFLHPRVALLAALWLAALAYALGLVRLARVNGASRVAAVAIAALGLIAGQAPHHLMNGLETGLMLAAVTWALALLSRPQGQPGWLLPALCGTLPFIRPDLLPLALLFLALYLGRRWRGRQSLPEFCRRAGLDLGIAFLFALPWALWCWSSDGSIFPSTVNAKRFYFAQAGWPVGLKAKLVAKGLFHFLQDFGLLPVFAVFLATTWLGRIGIVYGAILLLAYFVQFPGALLTYEGRYLFPLLPFVLLGATYALRLTRPVLRTGAGALLALALGLSLVGLPGFWTRHKANCYFAQHDLPGVAGWCNAHLPPGSILLIHDAGYIAYGTHFQAVDMVGLKTPSSIPVHQKRTYPTNGRDRYLAVSEIALRGRTQYLITQDRWNASYCTVSGLEALGWTVRLINADYAYKIFALQPPADPRRALQPNPSFHAPMLSGEGVTIK